MAKTKTYTLEEKTRILQEILKKTHEFYEQALREKELEDSEKTIDSFQNINV